MIRFNYKDIYAVNDIEEEVKDFFQSHKSFSPRLEVRRSFLKEVDNALSFINDKFDEKGLFRSEIISSAKSKIFSNEETIKNTLEKRIDKLLEYLDLFSKFYYDENKLLLKNRIPEHDMKALHDLKLKILFYFDNLIQEKINELLKDVNKILKNKNKKI